MFYEVKPSYIRHSGVLSRRSFSEGGRPESILAALMDTGMRQYEEVEGVALNLEIGNTV